MRPIRPSRVILLTALIGVVMIAAAPADARSKRPRLPKPRPGAQLVVGPTAVPEGSEITTCSYFKLKTKKDLAVDMIDFKVRGGSHHIHLYRPNDPTEDIPDGTETCNMALDFEKWGLILASQTPRLKWKLPKGVAFHFTAGEQLAAQTHYVDTGLLATDGEGWAVMNLHSIPTSKVTAWAGSFFGQDRDVVVPPHSTSTATTRCVFPRPIKVLGMTGHYHFRGVRFTAAPWDGTTTGAQFYENEGYQEPAFVHFGDDAPEIPGVEWTCEYNNDTDQEFKFGPFTDNNEHCNFFMFYYPSLTNREFMTCVQKDSVVTVKVH